MVCEMSPCHRRSSSIVFGVKLVNFGRKCKLSAEKLANESKEGHPLVKFDGVGHPLNIKRLRRYVRTYLRHVCGAGRKIIYYRELRNDLF